MSALNGGDKGTVTVKVTCTFAGKTYEAGGTGQFADGDAKANAVVALRKQLPKESFRKWIKYRDARSGKESKFYVG